MTKIFLGLQYTHTAYNCRMYKLSTSYDHSVEIKCFFIFYRNPMRNRAN